jgi:hypothetical protein
MKNETTTNREYEIEEPAQVAGAEAQMNPALQDWE